MSQTKATNSQTKNNSMKIIVIVVAFIMWGATLYMNALMLSKIFYIMGLEENYKVTNDEESRRKLKDWYDIDFKKD